MPRFVSRFVWSEVFFFEQTIQYSLQSLYFLFLSVNRLWSHKSVICWYKVTLICSSNLIIEVFHAFKKTAFNTQETHPTFYLSWESDLAFSLSFNILCLFFAILSSFFHPHQALLYTPFLFIIKMHTPLKMNSAMES